MIRLGLHHLSVIQSLGVTGNVSATARELRLTQSAISHRMREAERRTDAMLFHRDGHSISLTSAGRRLLNAAGTILTELTLAERDLEHLSSGVGEVVRLGAACYANLDWFPSLMEKIQKDHPGYSAELVPDVSEDPAKLISNDLAEIVLVAGNRERSAMHSEFLVEDELVAVLPATHPLADRDAVPTECFADEAYVTHHIAPEEGHEYENIFRPMNMLPKRVICAGHTHAVLNVVRQGQALTILPRASIKRQAGDLGLRLRPILAERTRIRWYGLLRESSRNDTRLGHVLAAMRACLEDLLAD